MRVFLAACLMVALSLAACGCSSTQMPSFLPQFGAKTKTKSKSRAPGQTSAALAPQFNSMSGVSPTVSMPPAGAGNLPVYPGTNYPQTPYPQQAAVGGAAPAYANNPGGAAGHAPQYGAMPPSGAPTSSPYTQYPPAGGQAYGATPASPYTTTQVPNYAGQAATYGGGQAAPPYAAPQNPYGSPGESYNATKPYGSYTR